MTGFFVFSVPYIKKWSPYALLPSIPAGCWLFGSLGCLLDGSRQLAGLQEPWSPWPGLWRRRDARRQTITRGAWLAKTARAALVVACTYGEADMSAHNERATFRGAGTAQHVDGRPDGSDLNLATGDKAARRLNPPPRRPRSQAPAFCGQPVAPPPVVRKAGIGTDAPKTIAAAMTTPAAQRAVPALRDTPRPRAFRWNSGTLAVDFRRKDCTSALGGMSPGTASHCPRPVPWDMACATRLPPFCHAGTGACRLALYRSPS